jgi:pimeloyl-ACP methyl ester carboxylesterase
VISFRRIPRIAIVGQFAEVVYSAKSIPIEQVFAKSGLLTQPGLPLEHYDAIRDSILIDSFHGSSADLPTCIAYRPSTSQLIVSISGTASVMHALQDLRVVRTSHPSGRGAVHSGFWALYQGIKTRVIAGIRKGFEGHSPTEIVLTGHSMGGSIAYLFCIDLLSDEDLRSFDVRVQVAVFGSPRTGDSDLVSYFQELVTLYRRRKGNDNHFKEYAVKGYNDGKHGYNR